MTTSNAWGTLGHKPQTHEEWLRYYGEMAQLCRAGRMWTEARQWERLRDEYQGAIECDICGAQIESGCLCVECSAAW